MNIIRSHPRILFALVCFVATPLAKAADYLINYKHLASQTLTESITFANQKIPPSSMVNLSSEFFKIPTNTTDELTNWSNQKMDRHQSISETNELSARKNDELIYIADIPLNAINIKFEISGGSGDADMYIKSGSEPTNNSYDCRPFKTGNNEICNMLKSGVTYFVRLTAFNGFNNVKLVGSYSLMKNNG